MPRRFVDLHTHSTASDGSLPPAEVVRLADQAHLAAVALTDHDTVAGIDEARRASENLPELIFVPGIEISAAFAQGTLHILGLGIDPASSYLGRMMTTLQDSRATRNPRILQKLTDLGMPLSMEDVAAAAEKIGTDPILFPNKWGPSLFTPAAGPDESAKPVPAENIPANSAQRPPVGACLSPFCGSGDSAGREKGDRHELAGNAGPKTAPSPQFDHNDRENLAGANSSQSPFSRILGRLHIALAMVHKGYVKTTQDAFDRYIGSGRPAYVDKERLSPREAIQGIHDSDGLAVLAHPPQLLCDNDAQLTRILRDLIHAGLDGIEAFHPDINPRQTRLYVELARHFGMGITGGSDFHGEGKPSVQLGKPTVPIEALGERFADKVLGRK